MRACAEGVRSADPSTSTPNRERREREEIKWAGGEDGGRERGVREGRRGIECREPHVFHSERESYVNAATNWPRHAAIIF